MFFTECEIGVKDGGRLTETFLFCSKKKVIQQHEASDCVEKQVGRMEVHRRRKEKKNEGEACF